MNQLLVPLELSLTEEELQSRVKAAADQTELNPSKAKIDAGNYTKGKVNIQGLTIAIENPVGSARSGVTDQGKPWRTVMKNHYGYIKQTESEADGDHIDVFLGPHLTSDDVYVCDQLKGDGSFDEHKCIIGANSLDEAKSIYLANYQKGWDRLAGIRHMSMADFKGWLKSGDSNKPVTLELCLVALELGGPGSGNFGHSGRPGMVGGSGAGGSSIQPVSYDKLHGHATTSIIRYMGSARFTSAEAKKVLVHYGIDIHKGTLAKQLNDGRKGIKIPDLDIFVRTEMRRIADGEIEKKEEPKKEEPKKEVTVDKVLDKQTSKKSKITDDMDFAAMKKVLGTDPPVKNDVGIRIKHAGKPSQEMLDKVADSVNLLPKNVAEFLQSKGLEVKVGRHVLDIEPWNKDKHPRGWPKELTLDHVDGYAHGKTIVMGEYAKSQIPNMPDVKNRRAEGTMNHELGHILENTLLTKEGPATKIASATKEFDAAWKKDLSGMSSADQDRLSYFTKCEDPSSARSEAFAEAFGTLCNKGGGNGQLRPSEQMFFVSKFPNVIRHVARLMESL